MSLEEQLREALAAVYRVERELGGGGMSRVFVAEETALGRRVSRSSCFRGWATA